LVQPKSTYVESTLNLPSPGAHHCLCMVLPAFLMGKVNILRKVLMMMETEWITRNQHTSESGSVSGTSNVEPSGSHDLSWSKFVPAESIAIPAKLMKWLIRMDNEINLPPESSSGDLIRMLPTLPGVRFPPLLG
jgi:hypothetical protein